MSVESESAGRGYTMKEVEKRLSVKQNVLIYLCSKSVVIPDVENPPKGRGYIRRFSEFNVFEFATALEIKAYNIKVGYITVINRILRKFFEGPLKKDAGVDFQRFKDDQTLPLVFLVISDAKYAYFRIHSSGSDTYSPGVDFQKLSSEVERIMPTIVKDGKKTGHQWWQHDSVWEDKMVQKALKVAAYYPDEQEDFRSKLEVNLNKLAWDL